MNDKSLLERIEATSLYQHLKYRLNRRLIEFLICHTHGEDPKRLIVAELACGSAFGACFLAQSPNVRLSVAMDINTQLLDQAGIENQKANFLLGDIFNPPFPPNTFDLTWNSSAIEHFDNPKQAIVAMAELTVPNGFIFVGVPYLCGPLAMYYLCPASSMRKWLGRPYSFPELEKMILAAGLSVRHRVTYFFRFFAGVLAKKIPGSNSDFMT